MLVVGKASIHPENVSTKTRRNLILFAGGMQVKSACQSCAGRCPQIWWVGKGGGGANVRIRVCPLTSDTSLGQIISISHIIFSQLNKVPK